MKNIPKKISNQQDYLTLEEATKFCNYSQEYLSLRARQGKLKALKFSNSWVTKKEWLQEYQEGVEKYNNQIKHEKLEKKIVRVSRPVPPANLPVKRFFETDLNFKNVSPALRVALTIILIAAGVFFEKESLVINYYDFLPYTQTASQNLGEISDDFFVAAINHQDALKSVPDIFKEYGRWVKGQTLELFY